MRGIGLISSSVSDEPLPLATPDLSLAECLDLRRRFDEELDRMEPA